MTNFELIKQHEQDTKYLSTFSHAHMAMASPAYKEIIKRGEEVLPDLMLYLIQNEVGMNVLLALYIITGQVPTMPDKVDVESGYSVAEIQEAWIDWGKEKNYI
jgi:hypothetical protein